MKPVKRPGTALILALMLIGLPGCKAVNHALEFLGFITPVKKDHSPKRSTTKRRWPADNPTQWFQRRPCRNRIQKFCPRFSVSFSIRTKSKTKRISQDFSNP